MTRRQYIEAIVDDQIARGIVRQEDRAKQVNARLKGCGALKPMTLKQCKEAYEGYFAE